MVVAIRKFILTPIYRSLAFGSVFLMFVAHDWYKMPYKHPYLNILQLLSSTMLLLVTLCNNPSCISYMGNVMSIPHTATVIAALQSTETAMYLMLPCSLLVWMVWERCEGLYKRCFNVQANKLTEDCVNMLID